MVNYRLYLRQWVFLTLVFLLVIQKVHGQEKIVSPPPAVGIKTNLLYDATSTLNLGVEFRTGRRTSFDMSANWNPFSFSDNRKWKHLLIQPEFRYWTKETFSGHFLGLHAHYAYYNIGGLPNSIFSDYMATHRFQGWLAGAGLSYGYRWNFTRNWGMEATLGVGYAYLNYSKYECVTCGKKLGDATRHYFGPTKAGITLIYTFGGKKKATVSPAPLNIPEVVSETTTPVIPVEETEPKVVTILPEKSEIENLSEKYPFVLPASEFDPANPIRYYNDERDNVLTVYYPVNKSVIESYFAGNSATLAALLDAVRSIVNSKETKICRIVIAGFASPEGSASVNEQLAGERAAAVRDYILANTPVSKETILLHNGSADWQGLRRLVAADSNVPSQREVLEIIDTRPIWDSRTQTGRQTLLHQLNGGRSWEYMKTNLFPKLRNGTFIRVYWSSTDR